MFYKERKLNRLCIIVQNQGHQVPVIEITHLPEQNAILALDLSV